MLKVHELLERFKTSQSEKTKNNKLTYTLPLTSKCDVNRLYSQGYLGVVTF